LLSGICGVYQFGTGEREVSAKDLVRMRECLHHRGPDDGGLFVAGDRRVGLAHRRLAIVDRSRRAREPMANEDGTIWMTCDGAIYNHAPLRDELEARGHVFRSRSDTEALIHLYEEEGPDCLRRVQGMFGLAIWDGRRRELLLARDRLGAKPLFFSVLPGAVLFGSEIKAILADPRMSRRIDLAALYHYLTFFAPPAPRTLFQGIHKLAPATRLIVDRRGGQRAEIYWDPLEALGRGVEKRLMSDVPAGVFLSGGLDSSAIVALVARRGDRRLRTFSVGFKNSSAHNELASARRVARRFRAEHHEVEIGPRDLPDLVPRLIDRLDEPIADWASVPLHCVARLARESGTPVILAGEGSDEQLFGDETYRRAYEVQGRYLDRLQRLPRLLRAGAYSAARGLAFLLRRGGDRLDLLRKAARDEVSFWGAAIAWNEADKRRLLSTRGRGRMDGLASHEVILEHYRRARKARPEADFGQLMTYLELKSRLPELLLMRVDRIAMGCSIEARLPFLDQSMVEFTLRIPTRLKMRGGETKFLLRRAMAGLLPEEVLRRPRQPFGAPAGEWFRGALHPWAAAGILDSRLREEGLFDYALVRELLQEHRSGRRDHSRHLWSLFALSAWYDRWIDARAA
jgi:asparagine synthase (glutamine-hydrolysing)